MVPVGIPNWVFTMSRTLTRPLLCAISQLCLMAFYFLLWVGEYTQPTSKWSTHTQPFCLQDIQFYSNQYPIMFTQLLANPLLPDLVCLQIDNQKNGHRGQIISHHAIGLPCCPVKAVTAQVLALIRDGAQPLTPICAYKTHPQGTFSFVTNDDIVATIRAALAHGPSTAATNQNLWDCTPCGQEAPWLSSKMVLMPPPS